MISRLRTLSGAQQATLAVLVAAVVGALGVLVPRLGNASMLLASTALLAMIGVLAQWLWQHQQTTDWSNTFTDTAPARGGDVRISRLAESIVAAEGGDTRAQAQLHDVLRGLAAERLRDRRGIDADADPSAVAQALGPDLAAYLAAPAPGRGGTITTERLARFVTTLEDL